MEKINLLRKCIRLISISLLLCFYVLEIFASQPVPIDGDWKEGKRSNYINFPVSATIDTSTLTIECTSGRSDITIRVISITGFTYETTVPALEAYFITIDLTDAPEGEYQLILTNQWGDYLTGSFELK